MLRGPAPVEAPDDGDVVDDDALVVDLLVAVGRVHAGLEVPALGVRLAVQPPDELAVVVCDVPGVRQVDPDVDAAVGRRERRAEQPVVHAVDAHLLDQDPLVGAQKALDQRVGGVVRRDQDGGRRDVEPLGPVPRLELPDRGIGVGEVPPDPVVLPVGGSPPGPVVGVHPCELVGDGRVLDDDAPPAAGPPVGPRRREVLRGHERPVVGDHVLRVVLGVADVRSGREADVHARRGESIQQAGLPSVDAPDRRAVEEDPDLDPAVVGVEQCLRHALGGERVAAEQEPVVCAPDGRLRQVGGVGEDERRRRGPGDPRRRAVGRADGAPLARLEVADRGLRRVQVARLVDRHPVRAELQSVAGDGEQQPTVELDDGVVGVVGGVLGRRRQRDGADERPVGEPGGRLPVGERPAGDVRRSLEPHDDELPVVARLDGVGVRRDQRRVRRARHRPGLVGYRASSSPAVPREVDVPRGADAPGAAADDAHTEDQQEPPADDRGYRHGDAELPVGHPPGWPRLPI